MSKHNNGQFARVKAKLIEDGFEVRRSTSGHLIIRNPKTGGTATWSAANHHARTGANARAALRRIGAHIPINI